MQQIWKSFPRLLEQRINQLLDEAVPTPTKAFQIYKSCQAENLWSESFEKFNEHLQQFCCVPRIERSKGRFDRYLERPMDSALYENFHFTFRTARAEPGSIRSIASWSHHLMRTNLRTDSDAISISVIEDTITKLTSPSVYEKESDLEFSDFCETWKAIAGPNLDSAGKSQLNGLIEDLRRLDIQSKSFESQVYNESQINSTQVYLTQTELDWTAQVSHTAFVYGKMPKYPLRKGPEKKMLIELEKMVTLYNIIQLTDKEELLKHRENIRLTILDRCDFLLGQKVA